MRILSHVPATYGYKLIRPDQVDSNLLSGWQNQAIPQDQRRLVGDELARMYCGDVERVYHVAAEAVRATGLQNPLIVEVGSASGYYSEVLTHLLGKSIHYLGIDFSFAMIQSARQFYPDLSFLVADATALPLPNSYCDILFSPALLMHVPAYEQGVRESARVTRSWCIFHKTPVIQSGPTKYFTKYAYGVPVVELVFNEADLLDLFSQEHLQVTDVFIVEQYPLGELGLSVDLKTYVARKC